jgi:hypothetical protein
MIQGNKIVAFTPCGRKRYMDILARHVIAQQAAGYIDEWVLFHNPYGVEDSTLSTQLAEQFDWIKVLRVGPETFPRGPGLISTFYAHLREQDCIYVRLDDDLCYLHQDAIRKLVEYRIAHPKPFIVYPTIINNTRTSFQLQQRSLIPMEWGVVEPILCAPTAWVSPTFVSHLHQKALAAIESGTLASEFTLPSEEFEDIETGNISINCFAMFGKDMIEMSVPGDEEGYISKFRPTALGRMNARCGDAIVIHFSYHTQTAFMDGTGMLGDYLQIAMKLAPLPRTTRLAPWPPAPVAPVAAAPVAHTHQQLVALRRAAMARNPGAGLKA